MHLILQQTSQGWIAHAVDGTDSRTTRQLIASIAASGYQHRTLAVPEVLTRPVGGVDAVEVLANAIAKVISDNDD